MSPSTTDASADRLRTSVRWPLPSTPATPTISPGAIFRSILSSGGPSASGSVETDRNSRTGATDWGCSCSPLWCGTAAPGQGCPIVRIEPVAGLADNEFGKPVGVDPVDVGRPFDEPPAAQHRDGIGHGEHFADLVQDQHHGHAHLLEPAYPFEQFLRSFGRKHGGRLVEDQQTRIRHQCPGDLDALQRFDRQVADMAAGLDADAERIEMRLPARLQPAARVQPAFGSAELHGFGDGEGGRQRETLVHKLHTGAACVVDVSQRQGSAVDRHMAGIRLQQTGDGAGECGLAGAILADDGVNPPPLEGDIDVGEGHDIAEANGEAVAPESCIVVPGHRRAA